MEFLRASLDLRYGEGKPLSDYHKPLSLIEGNHRVAIALGGPAPLDLEIPLPFWLGTVRVEAQPPGNNT